MVAACTRARSSRRSDIVSSGNEGADVGGIVSMFGAEFDEVFQIRGVKLGIIGDFLVMSFRRRLDPRCISCGMGGGRGAHGFLIRLRKVCPFQEV
jgi:hypothetical protein